MSGPKRCALPTHVYSTVTHKSGNEDDLGAHVTSLSAWIWAAMSGKPEVRAQDCSNPLPHSQTMNYAANLQAWVHVAKVSGFRSGSCASRLTFKVVGASP